MQTDYQARNITDSIQAGNESDARNYDICLNTDGMTLDNCVETINNYRKMKGTL